jgi:hypothetical protein
MLEYVRGSTGEFLCASLCRSQQIQHITSDIGRSRDKTAVVASRTDQNMPGYEGSDAWHNDRRVILG